MFMVSLQVVRDCSTLTSVVIKKCRTFIKSSLDHNLETIFTSEALFHGDACMSSPTLMDKERGDADRRLDLALVPIRISCEQPIFKLLHQHNNTSAVSHSHGMVRLTTEVVAKAPSYINPVKDRELDLRGNRIPAIENLAVSKVHFPRIC